VDTCVFYDCSVFHIAVNFGGSYLKFVSYLLLWRILAYSMIFCLGSYLKFVSYLLLYYSFSFVCSNQVSLSVFSFNFNSSLMFISVNHTVVFDE